MTDEWIIRGYRFWNSDNYPDDDPFMTGCTAVIGATSGLASLPHMGARSMSSKRCCLRAASLE
jgi:hypothetical protein